ncbi:hypothetical protein [Microbulbifer elongatus]|uniref:hypothetical protein n=1 Tax=Microbulbifer elongatus TaxID=86173 RepID=UPI001CFE6F19|nr:hypothetical protein [Microbulbifer elongatus]
MKKILMIAAVVSVSGCETMFAHYRINDVAVMEFAQRNIISNTCVDKGFYDPSLVYEYNYVAASFLDFAVINEELYKSEYARLAQFTAGVPDYEIESGCEQAKSQWAPYTEKLKAEYARAKQSVTLARQAELSSIGTSLGQMGADMSNTASATSGNAFVPPPVKYADNNSGAGNHYLINTKNGMVQCKTTAKGYVFCF